MDTSFLLKNRWLLALFVLAIALFFLQISRQNTKYEGFTQVEPFVSKTGKSAYDHFYAEIYDKLYKTNERMAMETMEIVKATQPDKHNSFFLDIGCGTGCAVHELKKTGYTATGVDDREAMVATGKKIRPDCGGDIRVANITDPMLFDRGTFTHILCLDRTIYQYEDKVAILRNCHHWLRAGGYLVIHLVDPAKFCPIVPLGKPGGVLGKHMPTETATGKRITGTNIDFVDFKYKSAYDFSGLDRGVVVQTETFTDATTNNVRRNEHAFFMSNPKSILEDARYCRFTPIGEFTSSQDPAQKVYILQSM
jgi:SAM-dependent methyltransferase